MGESLWDINGVAICTVADTQCNPQLVNDGFGGLVIIWDDYRSGTNYDIYAQSIFNIIIILDRK